MALLSGLIGPHHTRPPQGEPGPLNKQSNETAPPPSGDTTNPTAEWRPIQTNHNCWHSDNLRTSLSDRGIYGTETLCPHVLQSHVSTYQEDVQCHGCQTHRQHGKRAFDLSLCGARRPHQNGPINVRPSPRTANSWLQYTWLYWLLNAILEPKALPKISHMSVIIHGFILVHFMSIYIYT